MAMAALPSAVRGNLPERSEPVGHRVPRFGNHLKSSRNAQLRPLQVERRFSHYEQKIAHAPIDRCTTKMPRRLQTRKVSRPIKPMYDDERIKWNERLAAWLHEDQSSTVEYIKFTDQFNIIEKQMYYCSACHEFFHLNLKERENRVGCPRFKDRHADYVRPVSIRQPKRPRRKPPSMAPKDPFGDRSHLNIPSLRPPNRGKRRVVIDAPPLPSIPPPPRKEIIVLPPPPSQASMKQHFPSPVSTTPAFSPIAVNDNPVPSPKKIEPTPESPPSPPAPRRRTPSPLQELPLPDKNDAVEVADTPPEVDRVPDEYPGGDRPRPPLPDLPDLVFPTSPDPPPVKKSKPALKKRKAILLPPIKPVEKPKTPEPAEPKVKRMSSDELARRMQMAKQRNGNNRKPEFVPCDGQDSDDSDYSSVDIYDNSFLEKYCLVSAEQLESCKRTFKQFDQDGDKLLKTEEVVNAIHHMFSPNVIDELEMCYIFRILETTSFDIFSDRMNLKLFAIVVSLARRISELDPFMKDLIGRVNTEVVDWKLHEARNLFEHTMQRRPGAAYKIPMESFWIELHAGGVTEQHEMQARRSLAHMKEMDLFDFLTYLPLFMLTHSNVVDNPLNSERYV